MPMTNAGTVEKAEQTQVTARSTQLPLRRAASVPAAPPTSSASTSARPASDRSTGSRWAMLVATGIWVKYGDPEVALQRPAQPAPVLHEQRLVEPEHVVDPGDVLRGGVVAEHRRRRVGVRQRAQREGDEGARQHDRQVDAGPAAEPAQGRRARPRAAPGERTRGPDSGAELEVDGHGYWLTCVPSNRCTTRSDCSPVTFLLVASSRGYAYSQMCGLVGSLTAVLTAACRVVA